MIYKNIGDAKVPAIAQGTTKIGNRGMVDSIKVKERINVIRYGIDLGLNFIDTAELYGGGFSEEIVGKTIEGIRDKVFLSSKFNPIVGRHISESLDNSLKRLKTDYIDLYQIHWPNPTVPIGEVMQPLSKLVDDGKIRYVGVSNFSLEEFKMAQSFFDKKIVSNQLEYNLLDRSVENDFLSYCINNDIALIAYSPLNQGRMFFDDKQRLILEEIARKYDKTIAQIVLRWLVGHDNVIAVVKTGNMVRMKENASSIEFELEKDDITRINELSKRNFVYILPEYIRLSVLNDSRIYTSIEDAIENKLDLIPSPANLAEIIKKYNVVKPIRVRENKDNTGKCYDIDSYDIMDQVKKYWAWIITYGYDTPIPAFVMK